MLESTNEQCLVRKLSLNGLAFKLQHPKRVEYKGIDLDFGYRIHMLIEDELIIELKAVEAINGIHEAQLLTYMRSEGIKTGLLMNFNLTKLKNGIERYVFRDLRALRVLRGVLLLLEDSSADTTRVRQDRG